MTKAVKQENIISKPRRGRPPAADTPGLSQADIVSTAIRLAEDSPEADISMRSLAQKLGVSAKALYRYVKNKDELLDLAARDILERQVMPSLDAPWSERLVKITKVVMAQSLRYPALAQPLLLRNLEARDSPEAKKVMFAIKSCFIDAGLSPEEVDDVFYLYVSLVQGQLTMSQSINQGSLSATGMPNQEQAAAKFETGLRYMIAGVIASRK